MYRSKTALLLLAVLALILSACVAQAPAAAPAEEEQMEAEATPMAEEETDEMAEAGSEAEFQSILACVEENFPAEGYFTNDLLPDPDAIWEPMECESVDQISVGMSWILNDGGAPWYNAVELGFFSDLCLEVELVRGGPGLGNLQTLIDGGVDFAVSAGGSLIPTLAAGPNGEDIVALGSLIKHSPYIWLGLDHDTPQDQRSDKELTPQDFIGKTVGLHEGEGYFFDFISSKYGISPDQVELVETGFPPDPVVTNDEFTKWAKENISDHPIYPMLVLDGLAPSSQIKGRELVATLTEAGEIDYAAGWLINEPRLMEEQGYMNWVAFQFSQWGWDDYSEVMVVRRSTLEENPGLVRRYVAAVIQGLLYLLENPDTSAEIAVRYSADARLTQEQALRRYQLQEALVIGDDNLPIAHMSAIRWNAKAASMIQYDQLDLPACE